MGKDSDGVCVGFPVRKVFDPLRRGGWRGRGSTGVDRGRSVPRSTRGAGLSLVGQGLDWFSSGDPSPTTPSLLQTEESGGPWSKGSSTRTTGVVYRPTGDKSVGFSFCPAVGRDELPDHLREHPLPLRDRPLPPHRRNFAYSFNPLT